MKQRFRVVATLEYEVEGDNDYINEMYGTTDPYEMAKVDQVNFDDDPDSLFGMFTDYDFDVRIEPVIEEGE